MNIMSKSQIKSDNTRPLNASKGIFSMSKELTWYSGVIFMLIHTWLHVLSDIYLSKTPCGAGLLNLGTTGILGHIILCCVDCPVHCRMLSSISGLYPLDTNNIPFLQSSDNQKWLKTLPMSPREQNHFQLTATG